MKPIIVYLICCFFFPCFLAQDYYAYDVTTSASSSTFDQVLAMGRVGTKLWIIASDERVYKVDESKLDYMQGRLSLTSAKQSTLVQSCPEWTKQTVANVVMLQNSTDANLMYTTKSGRIQMCNVLKSEELTFNNTYKGKTGQAWISSRDFMIYYQMEQRESSVTIAKVAPMLLKQNLTEMGPFTFAYFICPADLYADTSNRIYLSPRKCKRAHKWDVLSGYADKKRFYLLAQDKVYMFDKILFNEADPATIGSYEMKSYAEFFWNKPLPSFNSASTSKPLPLLPFASVTLALLLLIIVMLMVWMCFFKKQPTSFQQINVAPEKHMQNENDKTPKAKDQTPKERQADDGKSTARNPQSPTTRSTAKNRKKNKEHKRNFDSEMLPSASSSNAVKSLRTDPQFKR